MAGLVAIFGPDGLDVSLSDLTERFPSHATKRDEWQDHFFAAVRLHHGKVNPAPQPHWDESGKLCFFMDGHLYGSEDDALATDPSTMSSGTACLRAYRAGPKALARLNGSFALIVYDKERRSITLVSDRFNTRPLYYFQAGRTLVVASHIAALTGHPRCPRTLNRQAMHELIVYRQVFGRNTIYRGVQRLEPASIVTFDGQPSAPRSYWTPEFREPTFSRRDTPEVLAETLRRAARRRVSRNLRYGVLLSGGLDSRVILAAAEKPLDCFTLGNQENRQVQTAREIAELCGAPHHYLAVDPDGFWTHFQEAVCLTGGMYGCQQNHFLPVLRTIRDNCDAVFTGHNLEIYFRGTFLPARKLCLAGSSHRLPLLAGADRADQVSAIVHEQKHAFPLGLGMRVLTKEAADEHEPRLAESVREVIRDYDCGGGHSPLRAWDYFILRCSAQRYSFPNILCLRSWMDEDVLMWDDEILDIHLQMPPHWRYPDTVYRAALKRLSPPLAKVPYADTGLEATVHPYIETASVLLDKSLQRLRSRTATRASDRERRPWLDFDNMLRRVEPLRQRVQNLSRSDALAACGVFDPAGLERVATEHLRGERNLGRFLLILLTLDSWIDQFGADGSE